MSRSTMRRNTTRTLLLALIVQGFATACNLESPVEPETTRWVPPDRVLYALTPAGITASTVSWSQIDISWPRTPSATGYQLFRADGPTGSYAFLTSTEAPVTSFSNGGLTGATQYCYQVRAIKTAGKNTTYSAFSSSACATTSPPPVAAPSETEAVPQGYAILVRWKDNSTNEAGFRIQRAPTSEPSAGWVEVSNALANATTAYSYVAWNEQACFRVIAFSSLGSSTPSTPDCTTPPAPPSELVAKADAQGITLTWKDNSAFEDGYRITRRDQTGAVIVIATLPSNAVSYRDASVTPDMTYTYSVQATKDGGYSPPSNEATTVIATSAPAAPNDAYGYFYWDYEGYGWNYLIISWRDISTNEEGFRIEYSPDGSTGWTEYATSPPNSYYSQAFDVFGPPPPPACYRVRAFNSAGTSAPSTVTCVEPLGAPTDLGATAVDEQSIDLTWTDNASIETGYVVIRSTTYDGVYEKVAILSANATTHHDGGLASGQEYWYVVYATYPDGGWGEPSNYAAATTTVAGAALKASGTGVVTRPAPTVPVRVRGVVPHKRVAPVRDRKR